MVALFNAWFSRSVQFRFDVARPSRPSRLPHCAILHARLGEFTQRR